MTLAKRVQELEARIASLEGILVVYASQSMNAGERIAAGIARHHNKDYSGGTRTFHVPAVHPIDETTHPLFALDARRTGRRRG